VLEITERALTDRPAELSREVADHRSAGRGIALDDVGADVRSLALLPLIEPDVIKLDLGLVPDRPSTDRAAIVSAVATERERTGASILAEGIENEGHLAVARTLGATLGQGWLWGRPAPLPGTRGRPWTRRPVQRREPGGRTPFEVIAGERDAGPRSEPGGRARRRLERGARPRRRRCPHRSQRPAVRGVELIVVGPHFAGALVAQDLGDTGRERDRRFVFATAYDRGLVIAAARTLLARIAPVSVPPGALIR
jgi:EAL domain